MGTGLGFLLTVGLALGCGLTVGLPDGLGPGPVGASVGAGLKQRSGKIPKHASPAVEHEPVGQASAVQQLASATL